MKKAFFALTAVLAAGIASAVSANWTSSTTGTGSYGTIDGLTTTGDTTSTVTFTVAAVFSTADFSAITSTTALLGVVQNTSMGASAVVNIGGSGFNVYATGNNTITIYGKANDTTGTGFSGTSGRYEAIATNLDISDYLNSGEVNSISITVSEVPGTSNNVTYTLYINGTEIGTATHNGVGTAYFQATEYQVQALTDAEVYAMNTTATAADYLTIPEPTVLALLALGVAGIALKRRA